MHGIAAQGFGISPAVRSRAPCRSAPPCSASPAVLLPVSSVAPGLLWHCFRLSSAGRSRPALPLPQRSRRSFRACSAPQTVPPECSAPAVPSLWCSADRARVHGARNSPRTASTADKSPQASTAGRSRREALPPSCSRSDRAAGQIVERRNGLHLPALWRTVSRSSAGRSPQVERAHGIAAGIDRRNGARRARSGFTPCADRAADRSQIAPQGHRVRHFVPVFCRFFRRSPQKVPAFAPAVRRVAFCRFAASVMLRTVSGSLWRAL